MPGLLVQPMTVLIQLVKYTKLIVVALDNGDLSRNTTCTARRITSAVVIIVPLTLEVHVHRLMNAVM